MAMNVGGSKWAVQPSINVTPLVDVVLVLLIIFMVVTPLMLKQFQLSVPKKPEPQAAPQPDVPSDPPLMLAVRADGKITLNNDAVELRDLAAKLRRVFAARTDHVLFFDAADDVPYGRAAEVVDTARSGHAVTIAVLPEPLSP
jgi:biopolymer transport protein ExbD